jgi:hypothetical protein
VTGSTCRSGQEGCEPIEPAKIEAFYNGDLLPEQSDPAWMRFSNDASTASVSAGILRIEGDYNSTAGELAGISYYRYEDLVGTPDYYAMSARARVNEFYRYPDAATQIAGGMGVNDGLRMLFAELGKNWNSGVEYLGVRTQGYPAEGYPIVVLDPGVFHAFDLMVWPEDRAEVWIDGVLAVTIPYTDLPLSGEEYWTPGALMYCGAYSVTEWDYWSYEIVPPDAVCDGLDSDCDGMSDEQWVPSYTCGLGACLRQAVCSAASAADADVGNAGLSPTRRPS